VDKRTQIIVGVAAALLVLLIGGFFLMRRGGDTTSDTSGATSTATSTSPTTPGALGPTVPGQVSGMPGAPMAYGNPQFAQAGATAGRDPFAAAKPGAPGAAARPLGPTRPAHVNADPFNVTWRQKPNPPYVFEAVQPIRVASANIAAPPPPNTEVREVTQRRVSGIMSGDGVFAILEGGGDEPEIVKPGGVTKDGYRVVSINADSVKLQRRDDNGFGGTILRTQVVPLSDVPVGAQPTLASFPGGAPGAFPGNPRVGLPGVGGGGGGGKLGGAQGE
jgi:hypothetical protein